jgi:hypothetical protein
MHASVALGGRSLSQNSQFGRSCSAMIVFLAKDKDDRKSDAPLE